MSGLLGPDTFPTTHTAEESGGAPIIGEAV